MHALTVLYIVLKKTDNNNVVSANNVLQFKINMPEHYYGTSVVSIPASAGDDELKLK